MWYTLLIILDVFLLWSITNGILWLISLIIGIPITTTLVTLLNYIPYLPSGFITLLSYAPNGVLIVLYFLWSPPPCESFRYAALWDKVRREWFEFRVAGAAPMPHETRQTIYAISPHGIYAETVSMCYTFNPLFRGVTTIATSLLFWIPISREFAYMSGAMPGSSTNIANQLDAGKSIAIVPEGMRGALYIGDPMKVIRGIPGECGPRKGFIKCALSSSNYKDIVIVPIYNTGVERLYTTYHVWPWFQKLMLSKYYYPWPIFNFGWRGSFWPNPSKITAHVGKAIRLVDADDGKKREVDAVYEEYVRELERLIIFAAASGGSD